MHKRINRDYKLDFYQNNTINTLSLQNYYFNIQLIEITDPAELDDIIFNQQNKLTLLLSGLTNYDETYTYKAKYVIKSSQNQYSSLEETKNEINTLCSNSSIILYYKDYDNISAGPQLLSLNKGTNSNSPEGVGGYIQKWQVWDQNIYGESHQVFFTYQITMKQSSDETTINNYIAQLPVINAGWEYQPYTLIQLVDNNKSSDLRFTFYKDNSEIIQQTFQLEYYGDDLIIGRYFIEHNRIVGRLGNLNETAEGFESFEGFDLTGRPFKLSDEPYNNVGDDRFLGIGASPAPIEVGYEASLNAPYIQVDWSLILPDVEQFKVVFCYYDSDLGADVECHDMIAFKRNGRTQSTKYYLTLNDTKTNDVWYFSNPNDLFITYECKNYGEDGDTTGRACKPKN